MTRFEVKTDPTGRLQASGAVLVWAAVLISAAGHSIVRLLAELGAQHPVDGRNPITPCNVLLIGTLCAFVVLAGLYRNSWTREALRTLGPRDWLGMTLAALLSSALAPAFILLALEHTSVTNLVLVGRLEPLLFLALAAGVLREQLDRFALAGTLVVVSGVGLAFALENAGSPGALGEGELYAALAAVSFAASTVVSRRGLQHIPFGIFLVFRTGLATVVFFCTAVWLYGPQHFAGVRSPFLWQSMAVYGAVFVVGAQLCWFAGLKTARASDVSLAGSFSPVAGIGFALVLLGEPPTAALAAGGAVIVLGIAIGQFGGPASARLKAVRELRALVVAVAPAHGSSVSSPILKARAA